MGWALAAYNASGFLASLALPRYADRRGDDLRPMAVCAVLTAALAFALAVASSLPVVVVALVVLGGPAGVGSSLLFSHLRRSGAGAAAVMRTRALVSAAWVGGPPLATAIVGTGGPKATLPFVAAAALGALAVTVLLMAASRTTPTPPPQVPPGAAMAGRRRTLVLGVGVVFVLLQASNAAAVSVMTLFTTDSLGADVSWAGLALGLSAALEVPSLFLLGRLTTSRSGLTLVVGGCLAGTAYYAAMAVAPGPVVMLALQPANAWFYAVVAGVGLTLFQELIDQPALATGVFMNTRRIGAVASGPIIGLGSSVALGYRGVFVAGAALTVVALVGTLVLRRLPAADRTVAA